MKIKKNPEIPSNNVFVPFGLSKVDMPFPGWLYNVTTSPNYIFPIGFSWINARTH